MDIYLLLICSCVKAIGKLEFHKEKPILTD